MGSSRKVDVRLTMHMCRNRLAKVWFFGSGIIFILMIFQTIFGRYGDKSDQAWAWLLPSVLPNLSLIIGVLVVESQHKHVKKTKPDSKADVFMFRLSMNLSLAYLIILSITILLTPFAEAYNTPLTILKNSHFWLAPLQGLVCGALGAFFYQSKYS